MHTTSTSTHPTTQLDLVRGDAAARQRRAATYRFVHQQRESDTTTRRVSVLASLAAVLLAVGIVGGTPSAIADNPPLPQGYEPAHADGWYSPDSSGGALTTADSSTGPAPTPLPHGYETGRPDGWYVPGGPSVKAAGQVGSASSSLVPPNVR